MTFNPKQSTHGFLVTGTDTGIGKTIVSAMLVRALNASYFKPVQAGLDEPTDTDAVRDLSAMRNDRFFPESYRLKEPASPHLSAAMEGIEIDIDRLQLPKSEYPLIVEGAGGVMVPLTNSVLFIEIFAKWQLPTILCARTSLGTINHTLLSLAALRDWNVPIHGVIFVGDAHEENESIIPRLGNVKHLGRVPLLNPLDQNSLSRAFEEKFNLNNFQSDG